MGCMSMLSLPPEDRIGEPFVRVTRRPPPLRPGPDRACSREQLDHSTDLATVKDRLDIPLELRSCHTAVVEGYRIEGHVPAGAIRRLLERPAIVGLAVAEKPVGSPGTEGPDAEPYDVMAFKDDGEQFVFERITP